MLEKFKRRKPVVKFYKRLYPKNPTCANCGLPWPASGKMHDIDIKGAGACFFVCCEYCWARLSYPAKLNYSMILYNEWQREAAKYGDKFPYSLQQILDSLKYDVARNLLERKV